MKYGRLFVLVYRQLRIAYNYLIELALFGELGVFLDVKLFVVAEQRVLCQRESVQTRSVTTRLLCTSRSFDFTR